jgi:hypothetical protein
MLSRPEYVRIKVKLVKNTNIYFKTCYNKNDICMPINIQHEGAYESGSRI